MRSLSCSIARPCPGAGAGRTIVRFDHAWRSATVDAIQRRQRGQPTNRGRADAPGLRSLDHRPTGDEIVEQLDEILRVEVFVEIIVDLRHRRVATGAEAFDLDP